MQHDKSTGSYSSALYFLLSPSIHNKARGFTAAGEGREEFARAATHAGERQDNAREPYAAEAARKLPRDAGRSRLHVQAGEQEANAAHENGSQFVLKINSKYLNLY